MTTTITQTAFKMSPPKEHNPLCLLVPDDGEDTPPPICSVTTAHPAQYWKYGPKSIWEGWVKEAPTIEEYSGKRSKTGMPDKRSKAGKEWYLVKMQRAECSV